MSGWMKKFMGNQPESTPAPECKEAELLLARLSSSTLLEDKRATVEKLLSLCQKYPMVSFGNIPLLVQILQEEKSEHEMCQQIIQAFLALFDTNNASPNQVMLTAFSNQASNITTLMDLLSRKHTYLRLFTIRLLSSLLVGRGEKTQAVILNYPMGVNLITGLLLDRKEVIRNQVLLLLEVLTRDNVPIQKIVAFDGGFEQLLAIASSGNEEPVVVEDCLRLIGDLLHNNVSNQTLFCELDFIRRLSSFLSLSENTFTEQSLSLVQLTLKIIWSLAPVDSDADADRERVQQTQGRLACLIPALLDMTAACTVPIGVRRSCLTLLAVIVSANAHAQQLLLGCCVCEFSLPGAPAIPPAAFARNPTAAKSTHGSAGASLRPVTALAHLLRLAFYSSDWLESALSEFAVEAWLKDNHAGQLSLASSFLPQTDVPPGPSRGALPEKKEKAQLRLREQGTVGCGAVIAAALLSPPATTLESANSGEVLREREAQRRVRSGRVLTALLQQSADCKLLLASVPAEGIGLLSANPGTNPPAPPPPRLLDALLATLLSVVSTATSTPVTPPAALAKSGEVRVPSPTASPSWDVLAAWLVLL